MKEFTIYLQGGIEPDDGEPASCRIERRFRLTDDAAAELRELTEQVPDDELMQAMRERFDRVFDAVWREWMAHSLSLEGQGTLPERIAAWDPLQEVIGYRVGMPGGRKVSMRKVSWMFRYYGSGAEANPPIPFYPDYCGGGAG